MLNINMLKQHRIFEKVFKYRYILGLVIFLLLVLLKIHGSSIGMWENIVTTKVDTKYETNIFGKSRLIRSDEWNVQTPYYLSQAMSDKFYPVTNDEITSSGENMIVSYNAPVFDISILSKPFNWGFLLLGKDYGLSWYWSMKIILLILLSFEMCMILTKKDKLISSLGAIWIAFSPAVQWWFMQHVGDLIFYTEAIIVTLYYIFKYFDKIKLKILFCILFSLSCIGFVLVIYPPLQVPLAYLCLVFVVLIISDFKEKIKFRLIDILIFACTAVFIIIVLAHVILISKDALKVLLNTSYPGKRISTGGDVQLYYINLFLTNIFLPYKDVTFLNNCEVSSVYNFLPAVLCMFPILIRKNSKDLKYGIALAICAIVEIFYMIFKVPAILSKVTLLSYVTGQRMMVIYGITALYLSIWALAKINREKNNTKVYNIVVSFIIVMLYYISIVKSPMKGYVKPKYYILLLIIFFLLNYLFMSGKKVLFTIIMLIVVLISGVSINPIARGTGAIYNNYLSKKIQEIRKLDSSAEWIDANEGDYGNSMGEFLYANGVKTYSGTNFYPDLNKWKIIDPQQKYYTVYNRYEHIKVNISLEKTFTKLLFADSLFVNLNLRDLKKLNIKYVLAKDNLTKYNNNTGVNFSVIYPKDKDGFYIFKVSY